MGLLGNDVWVFLGIKFGTPVFGEFLPLISADPLKLHRYYQVSPEMFDQVQVRALAGPLKDIQRLVLKPLLCVLRVVVLLKGETSPQSEVLSPLERFSSRISL